MRREDDCIFCKIVSGKLPSHIIWENKEFLAFLSIFPNTEGFTVVATKEHFTSDVCSLTDSIYEGLFFAAKEVSLLLEKKLKVGRCAMIVEGLQVDHAHVKIIPLHGVEKGKLWKKEPVRVDKYFEEYEGYVSSHNYHIAKKDVLQKVAKKICED